LEKGCAYAIIDEPEYADGEKYIVVDNVLKTLQELARHHRRTLGTKIICVTGTNGKTTTKELIAAVLKEKYDVLYTQGNFNNEIGVPKTLLQLERRHDIAVVEAGASHPGDIKILVDIIEPDYGIITNVGKAHLLGFGSFEGVVRTKGELYDYLRPKAGTKVFINGNDQHLKGISAGLGLVEYGLGTDPDSKEYLVSGIISSCDPTLNFEWKERSGSVYMVSTHLIGAYNIYNVLAAACIGTFFDVRPEEICHAIAAYTPTNNRSELKDTEHNQLIIDAYNANPTSMMAALKNFNTMKAAKKMVILGDMRELGDSSLEEHRKIVEYLNSCHFDQTILVGEEFAKCDNATNAAFYKDVEELKKALQENQPEGYQILIKGSNGIKLFQLPEVL